MRCDHLRAYLDGESSIPSRIAMRLHLAACTQCRKTKEEWTRLSPIIRQLEDVPVPTALKEKLLADAEKAASARHATSLPHRSALEARKVKKLTIAITSAIALATALTLLPSRRDTTALAAVSHAMQQIKSVHYITYADSGKRKTETWVETPTKFRVRSEGRYDVIVDSKRVIKITPYEIVIIPMTDGRQPGSTVQFLQDLDAEFWRTLEHRNGGEVTVTKIKGPDGKTNTILTVRDLSGTPKDTKHVITVDGKTNLITRYQTYDSKKRLLSDTRNFEYNKPILGSVFNPTLPKNLPVFDGRKPVTKAEEEYREREYQRLSSDPKACEIISTDKSFGARLGIRSHPGYTLEVLDNGALHVFYLYDKDAYRIIGSARITGPGLNKLIKDSNIQIPKQEPGSPKPTD